MSARISDYDALDGTGFEDATAASSVLLRSPSGTAHSFFAFQSAPGVSHESSDLSSTLRVLNPEPGTWRIEDRAPREQNGQHYIRFYTSAAVENPFATCYAEASRARTDGTGEITISAQAVHEGPIESGATYAGTLLRPDFTDLSECLP